MCLLKGIQNLMISYYQVELPKELKLVVDDVELPSWYVELSEQKSVKDWGKWCMLI